VAWRILIVVLTVLALAVLGAVWVQHTTLRGNFGPGPNDVVIAVPGGSLTQQRRQAAAFCSNIGVERIADLYDVDATPEAVSNAYADDVGPVAAPPGPLSNQAVRAGCFAGLTR